MELEPIDHDEKDFVVSSDSWTRFGTTNADMIRPRAAMHGPSGNSIRKQEKLGMIHEIVDDIGQIKSEITYLNTTLIDLKKTIQENNDDITFLKKELLEKNDLRSIKKEVSAIKGQLNIVYGEKFFNRRK